MRIDEFSTRNLLPYIRKELAWGNSMNKSQIYLFLCGAITIFMLWDMADHFIGHLGFPRGEWVTHTWSLPLVLMALIILLQKEKDKLEKPLKREMTKLITLLSLLTISLITAYSQPTVENDVT